MNENNLPIFSIVIPVYDGESTLKKAIESVLSQSYNNLEVLIIDGNSKDKTVEVITALSSIDNRIRWISETDKGVYDAMNKGIGRARGEWLYFLGSDDYLFQKDVLAKVFAFIHGNPSADLVYGSVTSSYLGEKYDGAFDKMKLTRKSICHQAIFYKRTVFELLGNYKLKYPVNSDWEFNLRCFFNRNVQTRYFDLIIAYFSGGGLSHRIGDPVFSADINDIITDYGYHSIPLGKLKTFCTSNFQFFQLLFKRAFYLLTHRL